MNTRSYHVIRTDTRERVSARYYRAADASRRAAWLSQDIGRRGFYVVTSSDKEPTA